MLNFDSCLLRATSMTKSTSSFWGTCQDNPISYIQMSTHRELEAGSSSSNFGLIQQQITATTLYNGTPNPLCKSSSFHPPSAASPPKKFLLQFIDLKNLTRSQNYINTWFNQQYLCFQLVHGWCSTQGFQELSEQGDSLAKSTRNEGIHQPLGC